MSEQQEKVYWVPDELDEKQGICTLNDPDKRYRVYVKYDDMIHLWFYDDEYGFDCDTGAYGLDWKQTSHHSYYWCIGGPEELDKAIAQLQAIKGAVIQWRAKYGKRFPVDWEAYAKGEKTLEQAQELDKEA